MRPLRHRATGKFLLPAILLGGLAAAGKAQQTAPQPPAIRADVNNVLLDVVVRDKKGRAVRDLKPEELQVFEDGVSQRILSFREVRSAGALRGDLEPTVQGLSQPGAIQVNRQIRLVSLIFERLGNQSRFIARQAAREFVQTDLGANVYYAVFYVDRVFLPLLSYTNQKDVIFRAIDAATGSEKTGFGNDSRILQAQNPNVAPDASTANPPAETRFASVTQSMQEYNERLDRDMFGRISIFSLWGVIAELSRLPGRKSVLYFSEGLVLPSNLMRQYQAMASAANRANVSIHTIDARGLITPSDQLQANYFLNKGSAMSTETRIMENLGGAQAVGEEIDPETLMDRLRGPVSVGQLLSSDYGIDSIYANKQMNLTDLAERTGGMAIYNTNDFRRPLQELSAEFNTYYEVTYNPGELPFDGRFRAISVKCKRSDVTVQSRNGYFALPSMPGEAVFPYEVPLLTAAGKIPAPQELEFRAGAIQFGDRDGRRQVAVVFDLPLRKITFAPDEKSGQARSHISVMALVKDETGRVVAKLSRDVPMLQPRETVESRRTGRFIATRIAELPPGRYLIESVAADQEAARFGTLRSVLVVQPATAGPRLSEMALVRRFDKMPETPEPGDPLYLGNSRIVPTLDDAVRGGPGRQAAIFFVAYPAEGAAQPPQMTVRVLKDGTVLNEGTPELPPPNASGACPYLLHFGLEGMEEAQYEVRVSVSQDGQTVSRSLFVTIEK